MCQFQIEGDALAEEGEFDFVDADVDELIVDWVGAAGTKFLRVYGLSTECGFLSVTGSKLPDE